MKIPNFFTLNDWNRRTFFIVILSFQLAVLGFYFLNHEGIKIPIIAECTGLLYLLYLPGQLMLRCLRLHRLGSVNTFLYSIGLSIFTVMFTGFLLNIIYPSFGIHNPITIDNVIIVFTLLTAILSLIAYNLDKELIEENYLDIPVRFIPWLIAGCILPLVAVFATLIRNYTGSVDGIIILYLIIGGFFLLIIRKNEDFEVIYPYLVFCISLAFLLHTALITNYLLGADIHHELFLSNKVLTEQHWESSLALTNVFGMISVVILIPLLSLVTCQDPMIILKIIFPVLYAILPVCIYRIVEKHMNSRIAIISVFAFLILPYFYNQTITNERQGIAEIFLFLLFLVAIDDRLPAFQKKLISILFAISIIVSHYGIAVLFIALLTFAGIAYLILNSDKIHEHFYNLYKRLINIDIQSDCFQKIQSRTLLTVLFISIFLIFLYAWFYYISSSRIFENIVQISDLLFNTMTGNASMDQTGSDIYGGIKRSVFDSSLPTVVRIQLCFGQLQAMIYTRLVGIGAIYLIATQKKNQLNTEYLSFILAFVALTAIIVLVPFVAIPYNFSRIYFFSQYLSTCCIVIGGLFITGLVLKIRKKVWTTSVYQLTMVVLSVFLVILFFHLSGLIYQPLGQSQSAILNTSIHSREVSTEEFLGSNWISIYKDQEIIFADEYLIDLLKEKLFEKNTVADVGKFQIRLDNSYLFTGDYTMRTGEILTFQKTYLSLDIITRGMNKVYSSGGCQINYD